MWVVNWVAMAFICVERLLDIVRVVLANHTQADAEEEKVNCVRVVVFFYPRMTFMWALA